ncbi:amino alcohol phosphotransferase [Cryptosporidium ubiquitum]|uniref:Amino alcohol phosphotransferase n=1 Tax=Cryptosporidium ubiquitum TaxID=857276 RepID=A0A1J4MCH3_9CRYT|nr:amino alcohol phosphotransferase [Cryptosporidium ubiquitum]OII71671.1 amino alcohol phosphotransferase [Cryptosporidium ubiquitum]
MKEMSVESEKDPEKYEEYKYVQPMTSPLYNYVISSVCDKIVEFLPKSLSPNSLTIIGLISVSTSFIMLISIGENAKELFLVSAVLWFLYGIIDNLDGKQARRLGVSSNSGEFMDHAIDSVVTSFVGLAFQHMHNRSLELDLLVVLSYQVPFYFASWFHFQYGKLIIGNSISKTPYFTVDELNLFFIPLFILFEYFFPGLWRLDIPLFGGYVLKNWGITFNYCCFAYSIFSLIKCIHYCSSRSTKNMHLFFIPLTIHIISKEFTKLSMFDTIFPFSMLCITLIFFKISKILIKKPTSSFIILLAVSLIPNIMTKFMVSFFKTSQSLTIFIQFIIWALAIYKFSDYLNLHDNIKNKKK